MAVTLSEAAARHVSRYITRRGKGVGVRLGVKTTGCSGLAYKLEYADEIAPEDVVFEDHGVKVLIDPKGGGPTSRSPVSTATWPRCIRPKPITSLQWMNCWHPR